jgi:hypothetical protein
MHSPAHLQLGIMLVLAFSEPLLDEPRLRVLVHLVRGMIMAILGAELIEVRLAAHLMREVIKGHWRSSVVIRGHRRSSDVIEVMEVSLAAHRARGARHGALERLLELRDHVAACGLDAVT